MKHLLLVAVLAASGASSKHAPASETGSAAACADGAAKAVSALPGGLTGPAAEVPAKLRAILTARCTEDRWPAAPIDCYAKVHDMMGMKACRELLPADQQQKLMTEIRTVMMGAAAGGMPPHATGGPSGGPMAAPVAPVSQAPVPNVPAPAAPAP